MKNRKTQTIRKHFAPVFSYFSKCCNVLAIKPPCVKVSPKEAETQGLGSWRCGKCNKSCDVTRVKNGLDKDPE